MSETTQRIRVGILAEGTITPHNISCSVVTEEFHIFLVPKHVVCRLTLVNGSSVIGDSCCLDDVHFDEDYHRRVAQSRARSKVWDLESYLMRDQLYLQAEAYILGD